MDSKVKNDYLEKFTIYCLINNDRKEEAQLIFDLISRREVLKISFSKIKLIFY